MIIFSPIAQQPSSGIKHRLQAIQETLRRSDCTRNLLCCVCECVKNVLKGNVPLSKAQKSKLVRHRDKLRRLVLKKTRIADKKKLVQSGRFLSVLIPPIAAFLGTLFAPKI